MDTQLIKKLQDDNNVAFVEFFASWCPHCQRMMPVMDDVKALFEGRMNVYQFDVDENQEFARTLGVNGLPTFIIFEKGEELWRSEGEMDPQVLVSKIQSFLK